MNVILLGIFKLMYRKIFYLQVRSGISPDPSRMRQKRNFFHTMCIGVLTVIRAGPQAQSRSGSQRKFVRHQPAQIFSNKKVDNVGAGTNRRVGTLPHRASR